VMKTNTQTTPLSGKGREFGLFGCNRTEQKENSVKS